MSNYFYPWGIFNRPNVKDLAFVLACPSALNQWPAECTTRNDVSLPDAHFWKTQFMRYLPRLHELDHNPKSLNQFLAKHLKSSRLGFRFEGLILYWLYDSAYHDFELITYNQQIFNEPINAESSKASTIGEVDFILKNKRTGKIEQWELTIKFYLGQSPFTASQWIGLNQNDTLARKIDHLHHRQFRFSCVNNHRIDKKLAMIKGRFFVPDHTCAEQLPSWLNTDFPLGFWQDGAKKTQTHLRRAARKEWLSKRDFLDKFYARKKNPKPSPCLKSGIYFDLSGTPRQPMPDYPYYDSHIMAFRV